MLSVVLDSPVHVRLRGHANSKAGDGRVCAAVSVLCYALCQRLEQLSVPYKARLEPGDAEIFSRDTEQARGAFAVLVCGMELLARQEPDCVQVTD